MDMKSKKQGYKFELLHEQVSSVDLFPDKTHDRVSKSIYRLIDESDKAITIGVEGSWGSGKSTVIELLKGKIDVDNSKNTLFFIFDAWAHEGDPLRRIFLESLIKEIDPNGEDSYLNKLLLEIGGRSKSVKVTTSREASSLGKKLFVSAFMVPIGSALLSINKFEDLDWGIKDIGFSELLFIFGLILSSAPLLFLAGWWMCGEKDKKTGNVRWDFMESDSTENYTQDITEDGERTSIEFERYFKKIFEYVFESKEGSKYDRAVIVIDNLDRIDTGHAATIWSTLQTFFQHRNCSNKKDAWVKDLWFLVTYDREGLSRIWDSKFQDETVDFHGYDSLSTEPKQKQKITSDISKSFLGKNFQVVAEVPTPVMSSWQGYSVECVNKALNEWPEDEKQNVITTFQRYGSRLDISPTPREIQNFVNQIGLLGMSWGGSMSAEALALYALLRLSRTENELRKELLQAGLPEGYSTDADADELKRELAGLMFGVPKDKGIQLLLEPVIQEAMRNGDGEALKAVLDEQGEAFWIAWNAIRAGIAVSDSHTQEYILSVTKAMHEGLLSVKNKIKPDLEKLEKAWRATSEKWESKLGYSHAIPMMADLVNDKESFVLWCFTVVKGKVSAITKQVEESKIDVEALKQISSLIDFLSKNDKPLVRTTYPALNQSTWPKWLELVDEDGIDLPTVLPADGTIKSLAASLLANPTTTSSPILDVLLQTLKLHSRTNEWGPVADNIIQWANNPSRALEDDLAYELMLGMHSQCIDSVSEKIKVCIEGAPFWARGNAEDINKVRLLPILVTSVLGSRIHSNANVSPAVKNYWKNDSYDASIYENLIKLNRLSLVWEMARDEANKLAISVIRNNLDKNSLFSDSNNFIFMNDFKWIKPDDKQIVHMVCENSKLGDVKEKLVSEPLKYSYVLHLLLDYGNQQAADFVKSILTSLSTDEWGEALAENSYLLDCVLDSGVSFDHKYSDAFKSYFNGVMDDSTATDGWLWENFDGLLNKTIDTEILLEGLVRKYFSTDTDNLSDDGFISISGQLTRVVNKAEPIDVMNRVCKWLDKNKWDRLIWLTNSGYTPKTKSLESLESRISEKAIELSDGDKTVLQDISKLFSIEIDLEDKGK